MNALSNPAIWISYAQHTAMLLALSAPIWSRTHPRIRPFAVILFALIGGACAWMTRGWFGELSLTNTVGSVLFVVGALWARTDRALSIPIAAPTPIAVAILALATPMLAGALLLAPWDLYWLGYFWPFGLFALSLAVLAWCTGHRLWGAVIVAGVALWSLGIRHSPNLWDMLTDAPTWAAALVISLRAAISRFTRQRPKT